MNKKQSSNIINDLPVDVSVIMPVYNNEKTVKKAIKSVLKQSLKNIEIICIDDGSVDSSVNIIEKMMQKNKNIILLKQNHSGPGSARNNGIIHSNGKCIRFLDADDNYPDSKVVQKQYEFIIKNNILVCGGFRKNNVDGHVSKHFKFIKELKRKHDGAIFDYDYYQYDYDFADFMYSKKFIIDNNIFFPEYYKFEDPVFFVKYMYCAKKFGVVPRFSYCYHINTKRDKQWTEKNVNDLIKGLTDNLIFSKTNKLKKLHSCTLKRINEEYNEIIINSYNSGNSNVVPLLENASKHINLELLENCIVDSDNPITFLKMIKN